MIPAFLFSCKTQKQLTGYLQNVSDTSIKKEVKSPEIVIQKGDILSIQIMSLSTKPDVSDAIYNMPGGGGGGGAAGESSAPAAGYLVDNNGDIVHHRLGVIHAEGLTKQQLAEEVKRRLTVPVELLTNPTVIVKLNNFTVTMLGEVGQQGVVKVPGERITVIQAIGLAGGISQFGKKNNLKIIREINGQREVGTIDLSSKDVFDSPYYYLAQNDIIIVEETNKRMKEQDEARLMQKISFAFTLVTVAATITNLFIKN